MESLKQLKIKLEKKFMEENKDFCDNLEKMSPKEIISNSGKANFYENMLSVFGEYNDYDRNDIQALLDDCSLDYLYDLWLDYDSNDFDFWTGTIVSDLSSEYSEKIRNKKDYPLIKAIEKSLSFLNNYQLCENLKIPLEEFSDIEVDDILKSKKDTKTLNDFLKSLKKDEILNLPDIDKEEANKIISNIYDLIIPSLNKMCNKDKSIEER